MISLLREKTLEERRIEPSALVPTVHLLEASNIRTKLPQIRAETSYSLQHLQHMGLLSRDMLTDDRLVRNSEGEYLGITVVNYFLRASSAGLDPQEFLNGISPDVLSSSLDIPRHMIDQAIAHVTEEQKARTEDPLPSVFETYLPSDNAPQIVVNGAIHREYVSRVANIAHTLSPKRILHEVQDEVSQQKSPEGVFGDFLREELRTRGKRSVWLAAQLGIEYARVEQYVNGIAEPTEDFVTKAFELFDAPYKTLDDLLSERKKIGGAIERRECIGEERPVFREITPPRKTRVTSPSEDSAYKILQKERKDARAVTSQVEEWIKTNPERYVANRETAHLQAVAVEEARVKGRAARIAIMFRDETDDEKKQRAKERVLRGKQLEKAEIAHLRAAPIPPDDVVWYDRDPMPAERRFRQIPQPRHWFMWWADPDHPDDPNREINREILGILGFLDVPGLKEYSQWFVAGPSSLGVYTGLKYTPLDFDYIRHYVFSVHSAQKGRFTSTIDPILECIRFFPPPQRKGNDAVKDVLENIIAEDETSEKQSRRGRRNSNREHMHLRQLMKAVVSKTERREIIEEKKRYTTTFTSLCNRFRTRFCQEQSMDDANTEQTSPKMNCELSQAYQRSEASRSGLVIDFQEYMQREYQFAVSDDEAFAVFHAYEKKNAFKKILFINLFLAQIYQQYGFTLSEQDAYALIEAELRSQGITVPDMNHAKEFILSDSMPLYVRNRRFVNKERVEAAIEYNIDSFERNGFFGAPDLRVKREQQERPLEPIADPIDWLEKIEYGAIDEKDSLYQYHRMLWRETPTQIRKKSVAEDYVDEFLRAYDLPDDVITRVINDILPEKRRGSKPLDKRVLTLDAMMCYNRYVEQQQSTKYSFEDGEEDVA